MVERTCCPHCGGQDGYRFKQPEVHIYVGAWGDEPEAVDSESFGKTTIPTCVDCGKRVRDPITIGKEPTP